MYLDEFGEVMPRASIDGPLSAGIPGVPAAMVHLSEHYGSLDIETALAPAIAYAREGFKVEAIYQRLAEFRKSALAASPSASRIFLRDGDVPALHTVIRQPDLADTLQHIASRGVDGFYRGEVADRLIADVQAHGGIWTHQDLQAYQVVEREPVSFEYRGMKVTSVPPPSSGGVALAQILGIYADVADDAMPGHQRTHLLVESMRRAYRDRAEFLGDTDFVEVPLTRLVDADYIHGLASDVDKQRSTPSDELKAISVDKVDGADTTHFSVVDGEGNKVSATLSVNYPFGSGFVAAGTGVLLNDEMDDFSSKPGTPNVYGLVGAEANAIEPGKRMLSSMSPSFAEYGDRSAILGTPGGSRIITMVLLGLMEFYDGKDAAGIAGRGRLHHQYLPDKIFYEPDALTPGTVDRLQEYGHTLSPQESTWGNMQVIIIDVGTGKVDAASDPRGIGSAVVLD